MKPILLLTCRPEDAAVAQERDLLIRFGGLTMAELDHRRLEAAGLGELAVGDYRAVILGGSPFNASDPRKSARQLRVEHDLAGVLDQVIATGTPFLGLCYGVGAVTHHLGGVVDHQWGEGVSLTTVQLTPDGQADALFAGLPARFQAFSAHKESCSALPPGAVLLGSGPTCPVQAYRFAEHAYVTQFHPELDGAALADRLVMYRDFGYFARDELAEVVSFARHHDPDPRVHSIVANFIRIAGEPA